MTELVFVAVLSTHIRHCRKS